MVLILVLSVGVSDEQHLSTVYGIQIYRSITDVPISVYRQIDGSLNPAPQVTYTLQYTCFTHLFLQQGRLHLKYFTRSCIIYRYMFFYEYRLTYTSLFL